MHISCSQRMRLWVLEMMALLPRRNLVLRSEKMGDCDGLLWSWKKLLSGELFDHEGIWIASHLITIQRAQVIFSEQTDLENWSAAKVHEWIYDIVPTPECNPRTSETSSLSGKCCYACHDGSPVFCLLAKVRMFMFKLMGCICHYKSSPCPDTHFDGQLHWNHSMISMWCQAFSQVARLFSIQGGCRWGTEWMQCRLVLVFTAHQHFLFFQPYPGIYKYWECPLCHGWFSALIFFIVALAIFLCIWPILQDFMILFIAWGLGLTTAIVIKMMLPFLSDIFLCWLLL